MSVHRGLHPRSEQIAPERVVQVLNKLFSVFDQLAQRHGLEELKMIGDAYMVAGGLPDRRPDHAEAVAEMALALREEVARRADPAVSRWGSASAWTPARWWPA